MKICKIVDCNIKVVAWGWCNKHYRRWKNHGDPLGGYDRYATPEEAFAARTEWQGECLIWTGSKDKKGYGQLRIQDKSIQAHRFAWELVYGPISGGTHIDHKECYNPTCVNVRHLREATREENLANRSGATTRSLTGVRNVSLVNGKYRVGIYKEGKNHYFGRYDTLEEAAKVAEEKRKELFGEFAGKG